MNVDGRCLFSGLMVSPRGMLIAWEIKVRSVWEKVWVVVRSLGREHYAAQRAAERDALVAEIKAQWDQRLMSPLTFMVALSHSLPSNVAVVEEVVTTHQGLLERLVVLKDPYAHFSHSGWGLGWGLGSAIGVKLAWPDGSR